MNDIIHLRLLKENERYEKNILYRIEKDQTVRFVEEHPEGHQDSSREIVDVEFCLKHPQYGIFAHEYRNPLAPKNSYKAADVLACVVDEASKEVHTTIFDVKRNISAFSDDLLKDHAMLTAIKEVRDFIMQIHDEILHKDSFMLYYRNDGYEEKERLGLVTKNFEAQKFIAVADLLEQLLDKGDIQASPLITLKLKNDLRPYRGELKNLRAFAEKKIKINEKRYDLHVFLLDQTGDGEYRTSLKMT